MQWRRRILLGLLGVLIAGGLAYGFWPKARPVDVARVARAHLEETVDEEGRTRVMDRYVVSAPVAGFCATHRPGGGGYGQARSDAGDSGARCAPPPWIPGPRPRPRRAQAAAAAVKSAEEQVQAAAAEADLAHKDRDRLVQLSKSQFISQDRLDAAWARVRTSEATLRSMKFSVEVAGHQLEAARTALAYTGTRPGDTRRTGGHQGARVGPGAEGAA